jgi:dipeptidyl aminopeptidase/acylaminoacyl peptidase
MKVFKRILVVILVIIIAGFFYASWYFSGEIVTFAPVTIEEQLEVKKFHDLSEFGVSAEEITFTTYEMSDRCEGERITLSGWFIFGRSPKSPTFVVLHGQNDNRIGSLKYSGMLARAGYNVLAYDHRYHGLSDGDYCTFGYFEGCDVSAAIDYLEERGDCNTESLGVLGESMGAATAIMAAARDNRIRLLVEDSSFSDLKTVIADYGKKLYGLPRFPLVDSAVFLAGVRAGFQPKMASPIKEIGKVTVPTLIIHCDCDEDIKPEYSELIYDASGAEIKELHYFSGCGHTMGYEDHTGEYEDLVLGFIKNNMP